MLGYSQQKNPGPYEIETDATYGKMVLLEQDFQAGVEAVPPIQANAMEEVANAESIFEFHRRLNDLMRITRLGDVKVFAFVGVQMRRSKEHGQSCIYFLQNHPDPACFPLLKELHEKTGDHSMLHTIGRQGTPAAREYMEELAFQRPDHYAHAIMPLEA